MSSQITGRDRLTVEHDGEEIEVFNHVSVAQYHYVNSVNGYETFEPDISKGDMGGGPSPEYVTERVAELLYHEFGIEVEQHGIEAIDLDADEVTVL